MRKDDFKKLLIPYTETKSEIDRRFQIAIGADVPKASQLAHEILADFDTNSFGIRWWTLPQEERILIGDYLYQCAFGIEINLSEAKLHYLEWLDAREKEDERIADMVSIDETRQLNIKPPPSKTPIEDLPNRLEALHICGFFRAIGSTLDCLGAVIIGVLALNAKLRRSDIGTAENALRSVVNQTLPGSQLQVDFRDFYQNSKVSIGVKDWLKWTNQYRNMLIHRGRLIVQHQVFPRDNLFYNHKGKYIFRAKLFTHLARYPDRSDVETWLRNKSVLDEDAALTLDGVFQTCRDFAEAICGRLVDIWLQRRNNPLLLEQSVVQWTDAPKECDFDGFNSNAKPYEPNLGMGSPTLTKRMIASAVMDQQRHIWLNDKWK